jgi:lysophospholipid acyltransferase (LPLAT)-like uncharacterized protein
LTRTLDTLLYSTRRYALPLHRLIVVTVAGLLYLYARLVALTSRLSSTGDYVWPDIPAPSVIALWHGGAPSLLAAFAKRRPHSPVSIMVACDPRGDCLALLCRLLGLRVVRGDASRGGWAALAELARGLLRGNCVVVTADGGGPARLTKPGAVALASAAGVPLIPVGADCRPAIYERRKWDGARNPVPFGRVALTVRRGRRFPAFSDAGALERARLWSQQALDEAAAAATASLGSIAAVRRRGGSVER